MSINRVVLIGNLTRDPELRKTEAGKSVSTMGIAVNERYKNHDGEWASRVDFFNVVVWGSLAESCCKYLHKGRPIAVDGRLSFRSWEKDGQSRSTVEVLANTVDFLHSKKDNTDDEPPF